MPALPSVPGVVRITHEVKLDTQNYGFRTFWFTAGAPSAADVTTLANAAAAAFTAQFVPLMSSSYVLTKTIAQDLSTATGFVAEVDTNNVGGDAGGGLPASAAVNMGFKIARHYRGGKPKVFLPLGSAAKIADRRSWTPSFVTACNTAWTNYATAIQSAATASIYAQCNVSYYAGYNVPTTGPSGRVKQTLKLRIPPLVDLITGHNAQLKIGTQRRRLTA